MDAVSGLSPFNHPLCEMCRQLPATWVSIWKKGRPTYTPYRPGEKYPALSSLMCDTCKEVSATRFRP